MSNANSPPEQAAGRVATWAAALLRVRWFVRAPIGVYRARLGGLFGHRLLMLEHIGRKSGLARYVVLEVVSRPAPRSYIVASGFGARSQWFRNVETNPHVRLYIASHKPAPATAHLLDPTQAQAAIAAYRAAHAKSWSALKPIFEATLGTPIDDSGTQLPLIRFDLDA
jgi:deazaflavin-dependent oxidoreductase (nitroreductase family)